MNQTPEQLTLGMSLGAGFLFENFIAGENADAVRAVELVAERGQFVYLWGESGTGRTHLLHAACHRAAGSGRRVALLPLSEAASRWLPGLLDGWDAYDLVALDDVNAVAGKPDWERAVFALYNALRDAGASLLVSGNLPPAGLEIALPDLKSRLGAMLVYQLHASDDERRLEVLVRKARARGMELPEETGRYLLTRVSRDMHDLVELLDALDRASLAHQRKLTIPFVREQIAAR